MTLRVRYIFAALLLHAVLFLFLFVSAHFNHKMQPPAVIEAVFVQPEQGRATPNPNLPLQEEKKKQEEILQKKQEQQKLLKQQQQALQEQKQQQLQEQKKLQQQKILEQQKAEAQKKTQEDQQRKKVEEAERQKVIEQQKLLKKQQDDLAKALQQEQQKQMEQEAKQLAETQRKQQQKEEQQRIANLKAQMNQEQQARLAAARKLRQATWADKIAAIVRNNWTRLPNSPDDFQCTVKVQLLPGGSVVSAKVIESCGNAGLDASVERAVLKSDPLPMPDNPDDFDRNLTFIFQPHN
ncbi:MAG: cell envelope integrity protein TolA [Stenotrophobium sp.]